jgi:hypothetical protein
VPLTRKESDQLLTSIDTMYRLNVGGHNGGEYVLLKNVRAMIILFTEGGSRYGDSVMVSEENNEK